MNIIYAGRFCRRDLTARVRAIQIYDGEMTLPERITAVFSVATAVLASVGGAGLLLIALSSWLARVWASRILEREKADLTRSIEVTKADLTRSIESDKATLSAFLEEHRSELQQLATDRFDALNRRRDVYARLATKMRMLLRADMAIAQRESEKWAFLAAYDEGFIWASEGVTAAIRDLIDVVEAKTLADDNLRLMPANAPRFESASAVSQDYDKKARVLYQRCLLEMRRDCGFPSTEAEYRVISFR